MRSLSLLLELSSRSSGRHFLAAANASSPVPVTPLLLSRSFTSTAATAFTSPPPPPPPSPSNRKSHLSPLKRMVLMENIYTVPNFLSFSRLVLSPVCGYHVLTHDFPTAICLFGVASITDLLDGWIARRFNAKTILGSVLDPLADKVLMTTITVTLAYENLLPGYLAVMILFRDAGLIVSGMYLRYISLPSPKSLSRYFDPSLPTVQMKPTSISKFNTFIQIFLMGWTLGTPIVTFHSPPWTELYLTTKYWLQISVAGTTVASGLSYVLSKNSFRLLRDRRLRSKKQRKP